MFEITRFNCKCLINFAIPFKPNGIADPNQKNEPISNFSCVAWYFSLYSNVNCTFKFVSGDRDQTPRSAASNQALHCLHMSHKSDARLIWVYIKDGFNEVKSQQVKVVRKTAGCITFLIWFNR